MTTRPGEWAQATWRRNRTKRPCNLVKITRTTGEAIYMTDLDRRLTFEGNTYRPVVFAGMSAERREAAMRSGNQEAYGIIDGTYVVLPDLLGDRYRGAEVEHVVTDFDLPLLPVARHRKWIRAVSFTGSAFVATLEGRTQVLTRPAGGRFGGTFSTQCPYKVGGEFCRVDMGASGRTQAGVIVSHVINSRMIVGTDALTYTASFDDDFFRDGDMTWMWADPVETGTLTSNGGVDNITDTSKSWTTNEHVGREVRILSGAGGYVQTVGTRIDFARITANTASTLTFEAMGGSYASGTHYDICDPCENRGVVSPIVRYVDGSKRLELLLPTPFNIVLGDSGILRVGCNGLFTTCKTKFANQLNFGGDPEAPSAGKVIEPPAES